jgi:signal-transduction protein with cAMP-binding, CBS, and nucleotidyltransferase domain
MVIETVDLRVADFMTPNIIAVDEEFSFPVAVSIMANKGIGNLVIKKDNKPNGILTEREILLYLVKEGKIPLEPMRKIATQSFELISPTKSILDAATKMITKKKRLLVFENEKLCGIITATDLLRGFRSTGGNPSLNDVMSRKIYICSNSDSIFTAIKFMYKKRIGSVIISKNGINDAIFTERDLLVKILSSRIDLTKKVGNYASSPLITAKIGIKGNEAAKIMATNHIKRLPLTSEGRIASIVTARDIVAAFCAE